VKVLLDTCVRGGAAGILTQAGHEFRWIGETPPDPGDEAIILRAWDEDRVLVTLDKDFGELAIVHKRPHRGIIRLVDLPARTQGAYCVRLLERYADELAAGAIPTATLGRVHVRPGGDS
jgi:predicted nuclease of predicted toxin-antitoxin system